MTDVFDTVAVYRSHNPIHDLFLRAMFDSCPFPVKQWVEDQKYVEADIGVVWGLAKKAVPISWWREDVIERHDMIIIMDSGYIHRGNKPHHYQAVGLNGLNGRADFKPEKAEPFRWHDLGVATQPWREDGEHILLVGQVPWDSSVQHTDHHKWLSDTAVEIGRYSSRPIRFRPHPKAWRHLPPIKGTEYSRNSLAEDFENCWAVVTFNSNVGVDAVIAGIPVFYADRGSMARDIASDDLRQLESPVMSKRSDWAARIAYSQWSKPEMVTGLAWEHLIG